MQNNIKDFSKNYNNELISSINNIDKKYLKKIKNLNYNINKVNDNYTNIKNKHNKDILAN